MAGILTNPVAYAHLQTRGGIARQFAYSVIFFLVLGAFISLTSYARGRWVQDSLMGWMYGLISLQFGIALLFSSSRITASIRWDLQDEMIDSLRLMPLPASQAVLGYIFAGGLQGGAIMFANLILGAIVATPAGFQVQQWITANVILLFFCLFVWVIVASLSFVMKAAAMLIFGVLSAVGVTGGMPAMLLPGLAMLITPLSRRSIISMRNTFEDLAPQLALATVGQTAIGVICFIAACRKFRRSDWPAYTPFMGLMLLLAWQFSTLLGFYQFENVRPDFSGMPRMNEEPRIIASFLMAMLLSLLPIISAVREREIHPSAGRLRSPEMASLFAFLICMMQMIYPPTFLGEPDLQLDVAHTAMGIFLFLFAACYLAKVLVPKGKVGAWLLSGALFIGIVIPLVIDGLRGAYFPQTGEELTAIGAFSPIGFLIIVWNRMNANIIPALIGYSLIVLVLGAVSFRARGNKLSLPNAPG